MVMMNQNYQAEKLLKRLQNNHKKIMSNSRNSQIAHMLPFHFGFCTVWLSFLLMLLHKLTFLEVRISTGSEYRCPICRNILWAFTRPMVATKIRQYRTQF